MYAKAWLLKNFLARFALVYRLAKEDTEDGISCIEF